MPHHPHRCRRVPSDIGRTWPCAKRVGARVQSPDAAKFRMQRKRAEGRQNYGQNGFKIELA